MQQIKSRRSERGEAEMRFFAIVLIICGLISGSLWLLKWVKDTKDGKIESRKRASMITLDVPSRYKPGAYFVQCDRGLFDIIQNKFSCKITDDSYVDSEIRDFHLGAEEYL